LPIETVFWVRSEKGKTKYISAKSLINKGKDSKPISFTGVCIDVMELREGTLNIIVYVF
jgi:hypothetical protein